MNVSEPIITHLLLIEYTQDLIYRVELESTVMRANLLFLRLRIASTMLELRLELSKFEKKELGDTAHARIALLPFPCEDPQVRNKFWFRCKLIFDFCKSIGPKMQFPHMGSAALRINSRMIFWKIYRYIFLPNFFLSWKRSTRDARRQRKIHVTCGIWIFQVWFNLGLFFDTNAIISSIKMEQLASSCEPLQSWNRPSTANRRLRLQLHESFYLRSGT